jgi:hypothetical protein
VLLLAALPTVLAAIPLLASAASWVPLPLLQPLPMPSPALLPLPVLLPLPLLLLLPLLLPRMPPSVVAVRCMLPSSSTLTAYCGVLLA